MSLQQKKKKKKYLKVILSIKIADHFKSTRYFFLQTDKEVEIFTLKSKFRKKFHFREKKILRYMFLFLLLRIRVIELAYGWG